MGDGDVQRAGDVAGEADDTVVGGAHRSARRGGEIGAAMAGGVHGGGLLERVHHRAVDRTQPPGALELGVVVRGVGRARGDDDRERGDQDE